MADALLGPVLLGLAREAIARRLGLETGFAQTHPALAKPAASFVTLTQNAQLRGCIGSLEAYRILAEDVKENAMAAAFRDPRFPPLQPDELAAVRIEVSLLDAPRAIRFSSEADVMTCLRPGLDGVILTYGSQRATFLPQVWESLPSPREFMNELKRKVGLPTDFWDNKINLARYGVQKWKES